MIPNIRRPRAVGLALTAALLLIASGGALAAPAIRVTDAAGRVVEFSAPPQRIVVVGHGPFMATHLLYMFPAARPRLVGMELKGGAPSEFLPFVDPVFSGVTELQSPGPEAIAALHPDLVLMKGSTLDPLGTALGQIHVPVVYLGLETPDLFFHDVANLGTLLGTPERARQIHEFYQSRLARLRKAREAVLPAKRPRVLVLEYNDRGGTFAVRVPARPWMQTLEVESAGGRPVWLDEAAPSSGWTVTNLEQIARWDPDQIYLVVWYTLDAAKVVAALETDPRWSELRAVRQHQLHAFPSDIYGWDSPDPRWILGMSWLATRIAPERFRDLDMKEEVRRFFGTLYGMDAGTIETRIMPRVRLDDR
jgi:iron complex transport system substrate-binding protein